MGQQSVAANHVSLTRTVAHHNRWLLIGSWFPSFCSEPVHIQALIYMKPGG